MEILGHPTFVVLLRLENVVAFAWEKWTRGAEHQLR